MSLGGGAEPLVFLKEPSKAIDSKTQDLNQNQLRAPHTGDMDSLKGSLLGNLSEFLWRVHKQSCPSMYPKFFTDQNLSS